MSDETDPQRDRDLSKVTQNLGPEFSSISYIVAAETYADKEFAVRQTAEDRYQVQPVMHQWPGIFLFSILSPPLSPTHTLRKIKNLWLLSSWQNMAATAP